MSRLLATRIHCTVRLHSTTPVTQIARPTPSSLVVFKGVGLVDKSLRVQNTRSIATRAKGSIARTISTTAGLAAATAISLNSTKDIDPSDRVLSTMASGSKIHLTASLTPQFGVAGGITPESAAKATELLQENHDKHHIFFNSEGFHNHIVHHILTLLALGATPQELQYAYDSNVSYQRPPGRTHKAILTSLSNPDDFIANLGEQSHYADFLTFFSAEIDAKGWKVVLEEYVFAGDARAEAMFVRMYAGFLHPLIHLGFGIEFEQPAIVAEALAQAASHSGWIGDYLLETEKVAEKDRGTKDRKSIVQILEECRADEKLKASPRLNDGNKIRDGILKRAPEEMIKYASQFTVGENELEERTAEMINAAVYYSGAAQHPPHRVKFDFFYMHCVNCSIFFSNFLSSRNDFLTPNVKRRLLQWKIWIDIAMYVSRGSPSLLRDEITDYTPYQPLSWNQIFASVNALDDDGHASKLIRALANGKEACAKYEGKDGFEVTGDMFDKLGLMAIDSVSAGNPIGPNWVRGAGFDEAWKEVPQRPGKTEQQQQEDGARL